MFIKELTKLGLKLGLTPDRVNWSLSFRSLFTVKVELTPNDCGVPVKGCHVFFRNLSVTLILLIFSPLCLGFQLGFCSDSLKGFRIGLTYIFQNKNY